MELHEMTHGFRLNKITELPEVQAVFYEFEHEKTGAKLGWMKTDDENKTFSITFKTTPEDDTGVFHILEHSVLEGSEKYPLKDPFVELIKGSMNTFINAMTYPDKTCYPVSSRNDKDFVNMTRVYLDSVFHPLMRENENIFLQEGWHYEVCEKGVTPEYNGVVLNEMRGAASSVDTMLYNEMNRALFPDNCYRFVSGGDPAAIPNLTYDSFRDTYERYYHPGNSFIVLDGAIDIDQILKIINDEYLDEYDHIDSRITIPLQKGGIDIHCTHDYAVDDEKSNQGLLGLGCVIGTYEDKKTALAMQLLSAYLADNNDAPLSKAIIKNGLGGDVSVSFMEETLQPMLMICVRNMAPEKRDEVEAMIRSTLEDIVHNGIPADQLEALLCRLELEIRERDFGGLPAGLVNCLTIMGSWLYGGDPTANFSMEECFAALHTEIAENNFTHYLSEMVLDNHHKASVLMNPSLTYLAEQQKIESDKLEAFHAVCTEEEKLNIWNKQTALKEWQSTPDPEGAADCLPCLTLDDISKDPIAVSNKLLNDGTLWHHAATKGIRYLHIYIPWQAGSPEELSLLSLATNLYGDLPLTDMEKSALDMACRRTFGDCNISAEVVNDSKAKAGPQVLIDISVSYLASKEDDAFALLKDLLKKTDFSKSDSVKEILYQAQEKGRQKLIRSGHVAARLQAMANISQYGKLNNAISGPEYIKWIDKAIDEIEADPAGFCTKLTALSEKLYTQGLRLVSMTSDGEEIEYANKIAQLLEIDTDSETTALTPAFETEAVSFISIPAPVSFTAAAGNLKDADIAITGHWNVFSKIASLEYLWNKVRVQGGAYGTGMQVYASGLMFCYSYRDPNPKTSLDVYKELSAFMREYASANPDLTRVIIGAISDSEPLFSPSYMGSTADTWYLSGTTDEKRRERRAQMLATTPEILIELADALDKIADRMSSCIVANHN